MVYYYSVAAVAVAAVLNWLTLRSFLSFPPFLSSVWYYMYRCRRRRRRCRCLLLFLVYSCSYIWFDFDFDSILFNSIPFVFSVYYYYYYYMPSIDSETRQEREREGMIYCWEKAIEWKEKKIEVDWLDWIQQRTTPVYGTVDTYTYTYTLHLPTVSLFPSVALRCVGWSTVCTVPNRQDVYW